MWKLQGGRRRKLKSPPQTGKVCLILEETDAWDAAHDTHIDMWPRWHPEWHTHHCICCAPSVLSYRFNNLLLGGEGIGPGQSSIISAQKKIKCFMQRMDTKKKKQFHKKRKDILSILIALTAKEQTTTDGTNPEKYHTIRSVFSLKPSVTLKRNKFITMMLLLHVLSPALTDSSESSMSVQPLSIRGGSPWSSWQLLAAEKNVMYSF